MLQSPEIICDYGPDTDEEIRLKEQLRALQRDYQKIAEPLLHRLGAIHASKTPRMFLVPASRPSASLAEHDR